MIMNYRDGSTPGHLLGPALAEHIVAKA